MSRRGCLWFVGGLLLAILAGGLAFVSLMQTSTASKQTAKDPRVQVLVAARDIPLQTAISAADVALFEMPPEALPEGTLTDPKDAVGQIVVTPISRGEVILRQRLLKPDYVGPQAALVMDPKKVLVALPATDLLSSIDIVRPGDRVDLMFSFNPIKVSPTAQEGLATMMVLQDIKVAAVIREQSSDATKSVSGANSANGAPRAFLLALDPQDALTLKYFRDNAGAVDLALRSPSAPSGPFNVVTVDGAYIMQRFKLRAGVAK